MQVREREAESSATQALAPVFVTLLRRGDAWNVFVVEEGRVHLREIQVAHFSARAAAIAQGVRPDEIAIVYHPPAALADGSTISLQCQ